MARNGLSARSLKREVGVIERSISQLAAICRGCERAAGFGEILRFQARSTRSDAVPCTRWTSGLQRGGIAQPSQYRRLRLVTHVTRYDAFSVSPYACAHTGRTEKHVTMRHTRYS